MPMKLPLFRNTIRNKLMLLLLFATILPIVTSMIVSYTSTKHSVSRESYDQNARLLSLAQTNLLNYMMNINQKSLAVYNSINVPRSLYYILEHNMEDEVFPNDLTDVIRNRNLLKDHLTNIYQSLNEINQVRLYVVSQQTTYLLRNNDDVKSGTPDPAFRDSVKKPYIEPSHLSHSYGLDLKTKDKKELVFTLHRPIFRAPSEELLAELSIDIRLDTLDELNRQLYDPGKEKFYLVDAGGNAIISSEDGEAGRPVAGKWLNEIRAGGASSGHLAWKDASFSGTVFYDRVQTPFMDWYLVKMTPDDYLFTAADRIARINAWVGIGFLAVAAVATLFISFRFTKPLLSLIGYVNQIGRGQMDVDIDIRSNDEIGLLSRRFRSMMETINNLILKEYRLELANKTNQLKALQAQVNPHFLYNALQSIGTVALQHKDQRIYSLVASLGQMMRYNMNTGETIVELEKELHYVQGYLELQKQRFDTELEATFRIDPESRRVAVPKMILQPLVENFFKHGFKQASGEPAKLLVESRIDSGRLIVRVEDNGDGLDEARLREVTERLADEEAGLRGQDSGIGLSNVLARLKLHYREPVSLTLANAEPSGLAVTLRIPLEEELI